MFEFKVGSEFGVMLEFKVGSEFGGMLEFKVGSEITTKPFPVWSCTTTFCVSGSDEPKPGVKFGGPVIGWEPGEPSGRFCCWFDGPTEPGGEFCC